MVARDLSTRVISSRASSGCIRARRWRRPAWCPFFIFVIVCYIRKTQSAVQITWTALITRGRGGTSFFFCVVRSPTAWKWEWFVARRICFIRRRKIKTQRENQRQRRNKKNTRKTRALPVVAATTKQSAPIGRPVIYYWCGWRASVPLCIIILSKHAAHAVPANMSRRRRRRRRRLFEHDILHI